jgi:hypothetical protein
MDTLRTVLRRYRTTLVLGAICAAAGAFIWFHERQTLSTGELEQRRGRLLARFVRARCEKLEIQRGGTTLTLVRERAEGEDGELGVWRLRTPVAAAADEEAVSALLGALEWMDDRREFRGISQADRTRMGLDRPRLRAWLTVADERTPITFGGPDARSEGVYAQLGDASVAWVVGKDVFEALDHDAAHFRDKALFAGEASPRVADRLTVRVAAPSENAGETRLTRDGARWSFLAPAAGHASRSALDEFLAAVDDLRAERFVDEQARELARFGLDAPAIEIAAEAPPAVGVEGASRTRFRLRIGRACDGHAEEVYALAGETGPVVCVREATTRPLARGTEELRERRVLAAEDEEVASITLTARAGASESRLAVAHTDGAWRRTDGGDAGAVGGDGGAAGGVDADAVARWLSGLRGLVPSVFEPLVDASGREDPARLRNVGLDRPRATLVVARGDELGDERLTLGATDRDGVWLRRGTEPVAIRVDAAAAGWFDVSPLRVRALRAVDFDDAVATALTITRGPVAERAVRDGQAWRVEAPLALPAERARVLGVLRAFATLRADRWVAEQPTPDMGLENPRYRIGVAIGAGPRRELSIGSDTLGGAFARLDGGTVFVAPASFVAELASPLVAHDLLSVPVDDVVALTVERGTVRRALRLEGGVWREGARTLDAAEIDALVRPVLDGLAALRAVPEQYGVSPRVGGASAGTSNVVPPRARIEVERRTGEPRRATWFVGAAPTPGGPATVVVARTGLDVTFRAEVALVAPLLGEAPPPPTVEPDQLGPAPEAEPAARP